MSESAVSRRGPSRHEQMVQAIARAAQALTDERGLDGFTMDDLAEAVGVSRRTLFNHVPGKIDAVLGTGPPVESEPFEVFRSGGPSGDLLADIRAVAAEILRVSDEQGHDVVRLRRLLRAEPRLLQAVHERLETVVGQFARMIVEREGDDFDAFAARVVARLTLSMFDIAVEEFLIDSSTPMADHFLRTFDTATELFTRSRRDPSADRPPHRSLPGDL